MAVKHVIEYYNHIGDQYLEMVNTLKEMEDACAEKMVSPDMVENVRQSVEPLKANYERISYIMYLLNMPQRDSKRKKWEIQNKKLLDKYDKKNSTEATIEENDKIIKSIKNEF